MNYNDISITYDYPGFFLILASFILFFIVKFYYFSNTNNRANLRQIYFLSFFKATTLFLIILFFFNPVINFEELKYRTQKHLFLIDNSQSILLNDSTAKNKINSFISSNLILKNSGDRIFDLFLFGDSISNAENLKDKELKFNDRFSDLSSIYKSNNLFKYRFLNKYYKSVTVISDGNFNRGSDFSLIDFNSELNCISIGEVISSNDLSIDRVVCDEEIVFGKENNYEILVKYNSELKNRNSTTVSTRSKEDLKRDIVLKAIDDQGKVINKSIINDVLIKDGSIFKFNMKIIFNNDNNNRTSSSSLNKLRFKVGKLDGENNLYNNEFIVHQKVIENRNKIIIFSGGVNFNLHFLKYFLNEKNLHFQMFNSSSLGKNIDPSKIDLGIFLGFPKGKVDESVVKYIKKVKSRLILHTEDSNIMESKKIFNLKLDGNLNKYDKKIAAIKDYNKHETAFLYSIKNEDYSSISLESLPPVEFDNNFSLSADHYNPILKVKSKDKSIAYILNGKDISQYKKEIIINIDSFWKLLFSFHDENLDPILEKSDDKSEVFKDFLFNIISYLTTEEEDEYNKIIPSKQTYYSDEKIIFKGKIFDKNLNEIVNDKVRISLYSLTGESRESLEYSDKIFREFYFDYYNEKSSYQLDFKIKEVGSYRYEIVSINDNTNGEVIENKRDGVIHIIENNLEKEDIGMNLENLNLLVRNSTGRIYPLDSLDFYFKNKIDFSKQEILVQRTIPLTNNIYYFILVIFLLTIEWVVRKINGFL